MSEVALFDAKNRLSELIDRIQNGETIVITRRGKPVAQLAPHVPAEESNNAREAVARLLKARVGVSLGRITSAELIAQGRR